MHTPYGCPIADLKLRRFARVGLSLVEPRGEGGIAALPVRGVKNVEDRLPWLLDSSLRLVLFLIAVTFLSHLVLIYGARRFPWLRLEKRGWRRMGYFLQGVVILTVVAVGAQVRIWLAGNYLELETNRTLTAFELLRTQATARYTYICTTLTKTESSPPDFEEIQRQYGEACEWYRNVAEQLPSQVAPEFPIIDLSRIRLSGTINRPELVEPIDQVKKSANWYNKQRNLREGFLKKTKRTPGEEIVFFLSPFLFAVQLAVRITKVTANIP